MKTLQVELTDEQFARLDTAAKLLATTPENVLLALSLQNLDMSRNTGETWADWEDDFGDYVQFYAEDRNASDQQAGDRLEDTAPARRLSAIGVKLEVANG